MRVKTNLTIRQRKLRKRLAKIKTQKGRCQWALKRKKCGQPVFISKENLMLCKSHRVLYNSKRYFSSISTRETTPSYNIPKTTNNYNFNIEDMDEDWLEFCNTYVYEEIEDSDDDCYEDGPYEDERYDERGYTDEFIEFMCEYPDKTIIDFREYIENQSPRDIYGY